MAIDPLTGAIITGVSQIGGNLIQNSGTKRSQRRADKMNIKFFNMQNAYNTPESQMARLKKAGLNPNLIYGQSVGGATGNSGSAPSASKAAPYSMQGVPQAAMQAYQAEAQVQNTDMDTILKGIEAGVGAETALPIAKQELKQITLNNIGKEIDNSTYAPMVKDKIKLLSTNLASAAATLKGTQLSNELKAYDVGLTKLGVPPSGSFGNNILKMALSLKDLFVNTISNKDGQTTKFLAEQEKRIKNNFNK